MIKDDIERLLSRFMDGETSVEEEALLADHFRHATDDDKPEAVSPEGWAAYLEMFRQFDEGFDETEEATAPMVHHWKRRIILSAAAAVASLVLMVWTLLPSDEQQTPTANNRQIVAETLTADTTKTIPLPMDTVEKSGNENRSPTPLPKANTKKQRKLPYTPTTPKHLLAQAAEAQGVSEDSMATALQEAERLVEAMTVYQELRINEICDVEYEESY